MFQQLGIYLDALINNFVNVNVAGFSNILNNPMGILFAIAAIITVVMFVKTKAMQLLYLALFISACGYGSILIDGLKVFVNTIERLVTG